MQQNRVMKTVITHGISLSPATPYCPIYSCIIVHSRACSKLFSVEAHSINFSDAHDASEPRRLCFPTELEVYSISGDPADSRLDRAVIQCREVVTADRKVPFCLNCPKARRRGCRHVRAFVAAASPNEDQDELLAASLDDFFLNSDDEDLMDGCQGRDSIVCDHDINIIIAKFNHTELLQFPDGLIHRNLKWKDDRWKQSVTSGVAYRSVRGPNGKTNNALVL